MSFFRKNVYNFASISPFESFKANDDNNTLNCPHPPFHIKNHGSENKYKINMKLVHIY